MLIARDAGTPVGVPGLGMIPSWQFSDDPAVNPNINPFVKFPTGVYQTTPQPLGPYFSSGLGGLRGLRGVGSVMSTIGWLIDIASVGLSTYHGYKRNNSVGWAIGWGLLGGLFPIITPAVAFAQGFGQKKKS